MMPPGYAGTGMTAWNQRDSVAANAKWRLGL
jgi:hypothetical protein